MLDSRKLYVDSMCEVKSMLAPWTDQNIWNFADHVFEHNAIYVVGRQHFLDYKQQLIDAADRCCIIFDNSAEGSWTLISQLQTMGIEQAVLDKKIFVISGGDLDPKYPHLLHEYFLTCILDYEENVAAADRMLDIYHKQHKPYKFLFLNGRARPHRKYLYEKFRHTGVLDHSLWTMLDSRPCINRNFSYQYDGVNLMATASELRRLPADYEVQQYRQTEISTGPAERTFVKNEIFKNQWGEIYLQIEPYVDTYFSLVTETILEQPWSFRTEKIAKPIAIGHPWIVVSNKGFYKDIRNLGFQTFGHLIDERFDEIDNHQDRVDRIADIVQDLCQQDLAEFLAQCYTVCKYNQQHLWEMHLQVRREFPDRFLQFLNNHERFRL